jgi:uncharacterized damage-inducible protein DinB
VFDPKAHLADFTQRAKDRLANDLNALPDGAHGSCPGGCARTALNIVAECAALNGFFADMLAGKEVKRPSDAERDALLNSFKTAQEVNVFLDKETDRLIASIQNLDEARLGDVSDTPLGRPMTLFALAELPAGHMMYHDGQICQTQMLHGDQKIHW